MFLKLNGKIYEVENEKLEDFLADEIISKMDNVFDDLGPMAGLIKSTLNSFLSSKGFVKIEGFNLLESSMIEMISTIMEENKDKIIELELKEVLLPPAAESSSQEGEEENGKRKD